MDDKPREDREQLTRPGVRPDQMLPENSKENLDERLDEAVEETFPASDPVAVMVTK